MQSFIEKYQTIIIRIIVGVGVLLALFLLAATFVKMKEYRFVGSGVQATNTITVTGTGKVSRAPDTAKITFTVSGEEKEVKTAQAIVSKKIDAVSAALKNLGIEEKYIKTDSYTSYPQYTYPEITCMSTHCPKPGNPILRGYQVSHTITVSIKDLDAISAVLGALGTVGVTDIQGPQFGFEDDKVVNREARDIAIKDAQKEAERLAGSLGVHILRVVSFSETGSVPPSYYMRDAVAEKTLSAGAAPSIPVGDQNVTSTVTVVYEIQ